MTLLDTTFRLAASINDSCGKPICAGTSGIPSATQTLGTGSHGALSEATNLALLIIGILSVIFVIVGGFQYVLSGGNPGRTKQARETIIYAMVGLVLASAAYTIVQFALSRI